MSTDIDSNNDRDTPWHEGELAAQGRAGASEKITPLGSKLIRDHMPDQHRQMFEQLPMLIIGAEGVDGNLWATALFGEPGFIRSPNPRQLDVHARLSPEHPLADSLTAGSQVGVLGIQQISRRRNRANGTISTRDENGFSLHVSQSFGNCPKYITTRCPPPRLNQSQLTWETFSHWPDRGIEMIATADTFFIASVFDDGQPSPNRGVDVSHRGGEPGFLLFDKQQRLLIPDYAGNNFFNTIGNLTLDPRAGLLFMDFDTGESLYLTGTADVVWREDEELPFEEVDRMIRLTLKKGRIARNALVATASC
ncbi:pyridoxamine 5'-phosphate oxidase family protein [Porticoccus sp.]